MVIKLGDRGLYRDAAGKEHPAAECVHVWPGGQAVNIVYTEGGVQYADCNVPVIKREERTAPGRFFEKGAEYDES